jgi:hypothetical protein
MHRALVFAAAASVVAGCGAHLHRVDLQPVARRDGPPLGVVVSAAGATEDLLWSAEDHGSKDSAIVLRVHVQNQSGATRIIDPAAFRLSLTGVGGRRVTTRCSSAGHGEMPSNVSAEKTPPFPLEPGQHAQLWLIFEGWEGLPLSSAARMELEPPAPSGEPTTPLVLGDPLAPSARWRLWHMGGVLMLRAGLSPSPGGGGASSFGFQSTGAVGRLIFGMSNVFAHWNDGGTEAKRYFALGIGPFVGFLPDSLPGVVAGVDGLWATPGKDEGRDAYVLQVYAAVRIHSGQRAGFGGGAVPVEHRRRFRLRTYNLDIGYMHSFARGPLRNGGGVLFMLAAPLAAY